MYLECETKGGELAVKPLGYDLVVYAGFEFATTPTCHATSREPDNGVSRRRSANANNREEITFLTH